MGATKPFAVTGGLRARIKALAELRYRVPLTALGVAVLGVSAWVYRHYGTEAFDYILHSAALVAILLVGLNVVAVMIVSLWLWWRLRRIDVGPDLELESNTPTASGFSYPALARWPLVSVQLTWKHPATVDVTTQQALGQAREILTPRERGNHTGVSRRFVVSDVFGLARFALTRHTAQRLHILPGRSQANAQALERIRGGDALSFPSGPAEGELLDLRRYAHGDPLRYILWKVFARTRQCVVRRPEQAIMPSPSMAAYFVAGPEDEATACAARLFLEQGLLGESFLFAADGAAAPTSDGRVALEQLIESVCYREQGGAGLEQFLGLAKERRQTALLLFLPAAAGPWLTHVERLARRIPDAGVIIGLDRTPAPASDTSRWRRLLFGSDTLQERLDGALPELIKQISYRGWQVHLLHRPSGGLLAPAQLWGGLR